MAASTPRGISYPTSEDKIKDGSTPSALADDFMGMALGADTAITQGVQEAKDDATTKYGGLPVRVTAVEQKNTAQDGRLEGLDAYAAALAAKTVAIDAPSGFDANSVTAQAVHMVRLADSATNMPGTGSWLLWTYPLDELLMQTALRYSGTEPRLFGRAWTPTGWEAWNRLDADKWADRLAGIESKNASQDQRIDALKTSHISLDTDGVPYFDPGSMAVQVLQDDDGVPYFMQALVA